MKPEEGGRPDFLSRRNFFKLAGLSGLAVCSGVTSAHSKGVPGKKRVLIVGAGIAGLAASQRLQNAGFSTVVLEARERLGGRIWTDRNGFDLGAGWIHGRRNNPLVAMARSAKAQIFSFDYNKMWRYSATGELSDTIDRQIDSDFDRLAKSIAKVQSRSARSTALSGFISKEIEKLPAERRDGLRYAVETNITHEYAADPARLSLRYFDEGAEQTGGDLLFPNGYSCLLKVMGKPDEILLGHVVKKIITSGDSVMIDTNRGRISGDAVVITLPLGVLKSGKVVFSPELPPGHLQAIERLGFGTLNKLFLRFPKVAWPAEPHLFGFVGDGWWNEWVNYVPVNGQPVLLGFNAGSIAEKSESQSGHALVRPALSVLRSMFGPSLPEPVQVVATRWGNDPFSLGSYSSYAPGSFPGDRAALRAPISSRAIFAGEACSLEHPATVHGALTSGFHAAGILIRQLQVG